MEVARVRVQEPHLGDAGLDDPRMGVADVGDVVHAVEVGPAVGVEQVGALAADDVERRPVAERQRRPEAAAARAARRSSVAVIPTARSAAAASAGLDAGQALEERPGRRLGDRQIRIVGIEPGLVGAQGDARRQAQRDELDEDRALASVEREGLLEPVADVGDRRRAGRPRRARRRRPRPRAR